MSNPLCQIKETRNLNVCEQRQRMIGHSIAFLKPVALGFHWGYRKPPLGTLWSTSVSLTVSDGWLELPGFTGTASWVICLMDLCLMEKNVHCHIDDFMAWKSYWKFIRLKPTAFFYLFLYLHITPYPTRPIMLCLHLLLLLNVYLTFLKKSFLFSIF